MNKDATSPKVSFWSQLGPILLLGSFAVLLLKCAPLYWPLALTAFAGYATTLYLKRGGFYLSIFILAAVCILLMRTGAEMFWSMMLSSSIALSWFLILLADQEKSFSWMSQTQKTLSLEENVQMLEKQLREAKVSLSRESKDLIAEKERLNIQLNETKAQLLQTRDAFQNSEKEKEKLIEKCEGLSQDVFASQRKEIAFQHALEDAQTQLIKLKNQSVSAVDQIKETASNIIPMEEIDPEEKIRIEQIRHQYANLREQFEEKSEALDQARKDLFKTENMLLTLQKNWEEREQELSEEDLYLSRDLKKTEEECRDLEAQITILQEFITSLLSPKKRTTRSKKSSDKLDQEGVLPLLLQEKIDQVRR